MQSVRLDASPGAINHSFLNSSKRSDIFSFVDKMKIESLDELKHREKSGPARFYHHKTFTFCITKTQSCFLLNANTFYTSLIKMLQIFWIFWLNIFSVALLLPQNTKKDRKRETFLKLKRLKKNHTGKISEQKKNNWSINQNLWYFFCSLEFLPFT